MFKKGLFKKRLFKKSLAEKWMKNNEDKTEKVKMKKSTIIIIEVVCAALIFGILIGVKYLVTNKDDNNTIYLENQVVKGISFTDFTLTYEDEKSNIIVSMINYTEENIEIKKIVIKLYASDNTQVSEITADLTVEGSATVLGPNQETVIENVIELDLTDISKVEYVVE